MGQTIRKLAVVKEEKPVTLGELLHGRIREAIEEAIKEELEAVLGAARYERAASRRGHRNGSRERTLTGPTGPVELKVPRATVFTSRGPKEWSSKIVPRYERRMAEVNEAIVGVYLSGGNTRRVKGALRPLLKGAPLSKSAVSRVVGKLKSSFEEWRQRSLEGLDVAYVYLDAIALKVRSAGKVVGLPVLVAVAVLTDGEKQLLSLEVCASESYEAWKGFVDDLTSRSLAAPMLTIIDGNAGLRRAIGTAWPKADVQRCTVHKLRNIERKVPKHALEEIREDYHRIVYAASEAKARRAYEAFERKWSERCSSAVKSLHEAGDELLTFFRYPKAQWKTLRTTNVIERLNEEFRRRVKTQCSLPSEDSAGVLLFALVASGQIKLRKLDGYSTISQVLHNRMRLAA
jgi:transposase-like protein